MKDLKKVVGENIKKLRKKGGLTQQELSLRTGISRGYIGDLENAKRHSMSLDTLQKLSIKLNVSLPDLLQEHAEVDKKLDEQVENLGQVVDSLSEFLEETGQHIQKEGEEMSGVVSKILSDMKSKRESDGLTLEQLADKLSVSPAYISQLERGVRRNISYSLGKKIEEYLKE